MSSLLENKLTVERQIAKLFCPEGAVAAFGLYPPENQCIDISFRRHQQRTIIGKADEALIE